MKEVTIYQINEKVENSHYKLFASLSRLEKMGLTFNPNDYKIVYKGTMDVEDAEDVYMRLQYTKPQGYKGHSLSVSDLVQMDGKTYFCDSYGFKDVTKEMVNP